MNECTRCPTHLRRPGRNVRGFTLIEAAVTIAILAILAALAVPGFSRLIGRHQVRSTTEDLLATLYLARAEAIKRGGKITLRQAQSSECTPPSNGDWRCGWTVFVDRNENGAFNAGEDTVLQASPKPRGVVVKTSSNSVRYSFNAWGELATGLGTASFTVKLADDTDPAITLCISSAGRIRRVEGSSCPTS